MILLSINDEQYFQKPYFVSKAGLQDSSELTD